MEEETKDLTDDLKSQANELRDKTDIDYRDIDGLSASKYSPLLIDSNAVYTDAELLND